MNTCVLHSDSYTRNSYLEHVNVYTLSIVLRNTKKLKETEEEKSECWNMTKGGVRD